MTFNIEFRLQVIGPMRCPIIALSMFPHRMQNAKNITEISAGSFVKKVKK